MCVYMCVFERERENNVCVRMCIRSKCMLSIIKYEEAKVCVEKKNVNCFQQVTFEVNCMKSRRKKVFCFGIELKAKAGIKVRLFFPFKT
jgi:hypothetical protein